MKYVKCGGGVGGRREETLLNRTTLIQKAGRRWMDEQRKER
jgi:hypothetical protein